MPRRDLLKSLGFSALKGLAIAGGSEVGLGMCDRNSIGGLGVGGVCPAPFSLAVLVCALVASEFLNDSGTRLPGSSAGGSLVARQVGPLALLKDRARVSFSVGEGVRPCQVTTRWPGEAVPGGSGGQMYGNVSA